MKRDYREAHSKDAQFSIAVFAVWLGGFIAFCTLLGEIHRWCH